MKRELEIRTEAEPRKAGKRPKTVVVKSVSSDGGGKRTKVLSLDGASASFSDDFLYVFKANVKAARKKHRERRATAAGAKTVG